MNPKDHSTGEPLPPIRIFHTEQEWKAYENELAQKRLRQLAPEREQMLRAAGVTIHNFGEKAVEALEKGDMELAKAITGKYVLPPEGYAPPLRSARRRKR